MKKSILALSIAVASVMGISQSAFALSNSNNAFTVLNDIKHINKIEVHGNVELYLSDGTADQVKVYNTYYSENALVQNQNGVLKITSYKAEKLVVWVTVSNLCDLSVFDSAEVKSFGRLSALELNVNLYNNALAQINMDAYSVNVKLNDRAKADVEGTITEANFNYAYSSFLNVTNLNSERMVKKINLDYPANDEAVVLL